MERVDSGATPHIPGAYEDFVRTVVPGLQKRGILREDYDESKMLVGLVLKKSDWVCGAQESFNW